MDYCNVWYCAPLNHLRQLPNCHLQLQASAHQVCALCGNLLLWHLWSGTGVLQHWRTADVLQEAVELSQSCQLSWENIELTIHLYSDFSYAQIFFKNTRKSIKYLKSIFPLRCFCFKMFITFFTIGTFSREGKVATLQAKFSTTAQVSCPSSSPLAACNLFILKKYFVHNTSELRSIRRLT